MSEFDKVPTHSETSLVKEEVLNSLDSAYSLYQKGAGDWTYMLQEAIIAWTLILEEPKLAINLQRELKNRNNYLRGISAGNDQTDWANQLYNPNEWLEYKASKDPDMDIMFFVSERIKLLRGLIQIL